MKFSADKNILAEAVTSASRACASKTAFSALDGVLLNLKANTLTLTGYNLETGIRLNINVSGEVDGDIIVDSRLFSEIIRKMPEDAKITVEVKANEKVSVVYGKIKFNIQGTKADTFPNIIELSQNICFNMKQKTLKNMLSQVEHAIAARKEINPALLGARFDIENNTLFIVATDAVRLALRKEKLEFSDMGFIVPEKAVVELIKNLSDNDDDELKIIIDRNQICFSKENYDIFSRLLDGKFVEYKKLIERNTERELVINAREFADSLERSLSFVNEKINNPVVFEIDEEKSCVYLSCRTVIGEFDEEIAVSKIKSIAGGEAAAKKNFTLAFNPRFMIEALRNSHCDEVRLEFTTEFAPIKILPPVFSEQNDYDMMFVVVPVRLR